MFFKRIHTSVLAALSMGCFILCACDGDINDMPNLRNKRTAMDEGRDIQIYMSQNGKVKGILTAPLMYNYQSSDSPYYEFPKRLHVDFYNDSLIKESQLDARYGKYRQWENKVFLRDSVVVINVLKGDTLKCDELWWDQNSQKFYTNKPARYSSKDKFVNYGKNGLEAKQDLSNLVFYDNSGVLPVPKDDSLASHKADTLAKPADTLKPARHI